MPTFDHNSTDILTACGVTSADLNAALKKLNNEVNGKPFEPYTEIDNISFYVLATTKDKSLLANTLNFVDKSVFDAVNSHSKLIEALMKYPPTADQIIKTLAMRAYNNIMNS